MPFLALLGFLAGLVTGISPCIVPVLPVVFAAGAVEGTVQHPDVRRSLAIVGGLVLSFSTFTLFGTLILSAVGLPQDLLRDVGLVILVVVALGLIFPAIGEVLERPFALISRGRVRNDSGGFVLGMSLGVLYVPCAGPVLTAITVVGASQTVTFEALVLTVAFAVGTSVPLLAFAIAGQKLSGKVVAIRSRASATRRVAGVILIATALAIGFNLTDGLQRNVPNYTKALQDRIEGTESAGDALAGVTGHSKASSPGTADLTRCRSGTPGLVNCGAAPELTGLSAWLNTDDKAPVTLASLRGKVVLVDFWTYSCINCQRTIPHLVSWRNAYYGDGFRIVGVHTPEFAFEHVASNVRAAAKDLGVTWPIALDNDFATWNAYENNYWPAEYLIDAEGNVRHVQFGEGDYNRTESQIRTLLAEAGAKVPATKARSVANMTPRGTLTPETYLGWERISRNVNGSLSPSTRADYKLPSRIPLDGFAFGGTWTIENQKAVADADATIHLTYRAAKVYLVLGGDGTVKVRSGERTLRTIGVHGEPRLYTLVDSEEVNEALLKLRFSSGVQAYAFTFG